jgi:GT2 family glycosyltransferase
MNNPSAVQSVREATSAAPRVSVVVPAHNLRPHLREAVDSLLAQTWRDLEVIVIDDASTDGTLQALDGLHDPRLTMLCMAQNGGVSRARNAGLARARGEVIALLDGDDASHPQRIEKQLQLLDARPSVGLVGSLVNTVDREGRLLRRGTDPWRLPDEALKPLLLFTNPLPTSSLMVRRSALPPQGFRLMDAEDYAFVADVSEQHGLALLREPLVNYRISPGGIMRTRLAEVARGALATQRRLLDAMGMPAEPYDASLMASLMHFGRQPPGALAFDRMVALRDWMRELQRVNDRTGRYPSALLAQACARIWDLVLLQATKQERLSSSPRYLRQLWSFSTSSARGDLRAKALVLGLVNLMRRAPATGRRA